MKSINARLRHAAVMYQRMGCRRFISELVINGLTKRIKSKIGYLRYGSGYEQKCIFVAGLPKSGSTWVSDLLRSLPGFAQFTPVGWNQNYKVGEVGASEHGLYQGWENEFRGLLTVIKGHTWGTPQNVTALKQLNCRYVLTVRDPRDVIISEYWFVRRTPHHASYALANRLELGDYISEKLANGSFEAMTLAWIRLWLANRDPQASLILRYEDLLNDPFARLEEAASFLGLNVSPKDIHRAVELNSFERKAARNKGTEDTTKFLRKGTSGQWREVFTKEQLEAYARIGEDVIQALGYESTLKPHI